MTSPRSAASRRSLLAILIAVTATGPFALQLFIPSVPGLVTTFGVDYSTAQLTVTLYFVGLAVAQLVYGPLSDRFGRRPVMIGGLALYVLGSVACLFATTIPTIIVGRVLQAVGSCAGMVLSRAIVRDVYDRERSASMLAYITMAMVAAPMLAPVIGGFLDESFGWRAGFWVVGALGVAVLVWTVLGLEETHSPTGKAAGFGDLFSGMAGLITKRAYLGYSIQAACTVSVFFSFLAGAPYVMITILGRPPSEYGLYFLSVSFFYMFGNFIAGRISIRVGTDRMILWGTSIALPPTILFTIAVALDMVTPVTLFATLTIVSIGHAFSIPNGIAGAVSVDPTRAGSASGLTGFMQMTLGSIASYVVGALLTDTAMPLAIVMMGLTSLSLLSHLVGVQLVRPSERQGKTGA